MLTPETTWAALEMPHLNATMGGMECNQAFAWS